MVQVNKSHTRYQLLPTFMLLEMSYDKFHNIKTHRYLICFCVPTLTLFILLFQPPPPGHPPNAAQLAAMQGANVVMAQRKNNFFLGSSGGGYTIW